MAEKVDFSELISDVVDEALNLQLCYEWCDGVSIAEYNLAQAKKRLVDEIAKLQKERDDLMGIASVLSWCNHGFGCPQGRVISEPEPAFRLIPCTCGFDEAVKKLKGIQGRE